MAILNREEFFAKLQGYIGEDKSDSGIAFLEDMTDTYNDMENRVKGDGENWEQKYKDLDESWRNRYRHRFFAGDVRGVPESVTKVDETEQYDPDEIKVEDLFTEKEEK